MFEFQSDAKWAEKGWYALNQPTNQPTKRLKMTLCCILSIVKGRFIDFNSTSTCLGLLYAKMLCNQVQCTLLFKFLYVVVS